MTHRLLFYTGLDELVASGAKTCTIRRDRADLPKPGDRLQLCRADAEPERLTIRDDVVCTAVRPIRIFRARPTWTSVEIAGDHLILVQIRILALAEGFGRTLDFLRYFERKGLPFQGVLIEWAVAGRERTSTFPRATLCPLIGCMDDCQYCPHIHRQVGHG